MSPSMLQMMLWHRFWTTIKPGASVCVAHTIRILQTYFPFSHSSSFFQSSLYPPRFLFQTISDEKTDFPSSFPTSFFTSMTSLSSPLLSIAGNPPPILSQLHHVTLLQLLWWPSSFSRNVANSLSSHPLCNTIRSSIPCRHPSLILFSFLSAVFLHFSSV